MNVALLWLINDRDEVLIARRAKNMDSDSDVWGLSVSGVVEPGETDSEGVLRETREELGLDTTGLMPIYLHNETYKHQDGKARDFRFFYARVKSNVIHSAQLEPTEVAEIRWISVPNLRHLYQNHPEQIIISDAIELWRRIFFYLEEAISDSKTKA